MSVKKTYNLVLILFFLLSSSTTQAQMINTVAGNGFSIGTNVGNGGPAVEAELKEPRGLAFDASGNLYIASYMNHCVRRVTTDGIINVFAGDFLGSTDDGIAATEAQILFPVDVAIDASGNVYIVEYGNSKIRKVTTDGTIHTVAGSGVGGFSGDGSLATDAELKNPSGVVVDAAGNLYIMDRQNYRIRKVTTDGVIQTIAGNGGGGHTGDSGPAIDAEIGPATGIALDLVGNLYIASYHSNRIRKITTDGIINTIAGQQLGGYEGDGGPALDAKLDAPYALEVDADGNVYIASYANNCVRKITTDGIINTIAGTGVSGFSGDGGPAIEAQLSNVMGIAMDASGNVYVTDQGNKRIRKIGDGPAGITTLDATFKMYPNPVSNELIVENTRKISKLETYNIQGQLLNTINPAGAKEIKVDMSSYPAAIYFIKTHTTDGHVVAERILKE